MSTTNEAMPHTFGVAPLTTMAADCVSYVNTRINAYTKTVFATRVAAIIVSYMQKNHFEVKVDMIRHILWSQMPWAPIEKQK